MLTDVRRVSRWLERQRLDAEAEGDPRFRVRDIALVPASGRRLALTDVLLDWDAFSRQTNLAVPAAKPSRTQGRNWMLIGLAAGGGVLALVALAVVMRRRSRS